MDGLNREKERGPGSSKRIMIIAGEASGDIHGARLVEAMRRQHSSRLLFFGVGGSLLREAGVHILADADELAVVGITEAFSRVRQLVSGISMAREALRRMHPDLLVLIDFPDFNLMVAKTARELNVPVLYYISPQVWAWRSGRVKKIRKLVDHMAVILPLEEDLYRKNGVPVTFVGHPLLDVVDQEQSAAEVPSLAREGWSLIGLMPGSRDREIARHFPVMLEAAQVLSEQFANLHFAVPLAPSVDADRARHILLEAKGRYPKLENIRLCSGAMRRVLAESSLVITASGTVTLEAAIAATPMIIIYRVSRLSYWIGRILIHVEHVGLVNLIAGRGIVPELLQRDATAEKIAKSAAALLTDPHRLHDMRRELREVSARLGSPGASSRTAAIGLKMLGASAEHAHSTA
ncbi:lipid-A-disaccharide synthase [Thermodesulfobacteriota bacterium]